ncbi:MAG: SpoIIE family protein phosphatase [Oscillospiraceae bacterium]|jgi:stage II sporulation protein E|nr:SpoIIE family protein phosphatase [Oscillospiraceae bacterium]
MKNFRTAAEYVARFLMAFSLTGANVLGGLSPFAVGFIAASSSASGSVVALTGGVLGYILFGPFLWSVKYIAVALLVCTASVVFRDTEFGRGEWFMPVSACAITACIGVIAISDTVLTVPAVILALTDAILAGGCAYFYKTALSPWSGRWGFEHRAEVAHTISVLILFSTLLISLAGVRIFSVISVGRTLATLAVFFAAFKGGVGMGAAAGVCIGLSMDAAFGAPPIFGTAYGVAGLVSGMFSRRSRFAFALAFILVDAALALLFTGFAGSIALVYEVFIASVAFMLLPQTLLSRLSVLFPAPPGGSGALKAREYTKNRVEQASAAFREIHDSVKAASPSRRNDNDIASVFDRAADSVCRNCKKSAACWQRGYQTTLDVMNNISPKMLDRGRIETDDFPEWFAESCSNLSGFTNAVNLELRELLYRRQLRNRLSRNLGAVCSQYSDISSILKGISAELGSGIGLEPELEARLKKYLQSLGHQAEAAVFRDRGGRLHAEIAGAGISSLRRDESYLEKLSSALGVRLCTPSDVFTPDKLTLLEAEPLAATVGISCMKRRGNPVSGDRGAYFKTDDGTLYVMLSDGMGAGEGAARSSAAATKILERLLRSGVAPETAMHMLSDVMLLKNEDDTDCAALDLICLDLFSGEMTMFKYGAAPSYLKRGDAVKRITGTSLAAGLGAPHDLPDRVKLDVGAGSVAVVVSDGVLGGGDDKWLTDAIAAFDGDCPKDLARELVEAAAKNEFPEDDMTAIAIRVTYRP